MHVSRTVPAVSLTHQLPKGIASATEGICRNSPHPPALSALRTARCEAMTWIWTWIPHSQLGTTLKGPPCLWRLAKSSDGTVSLITFFLCQILLPSHPCHRCGPWEHSRTLISSSVCFGGAGGVVGWGVRASWHCPGVHRFYISRQQKPGSENANLIQGLWKKPFTLTYCFLADFLYLWTLSSPFPPATTQHIDMILGQRCWRLFRSSCSSSHSYMTSIKITGKSVH